MRECIRYRERTCQGLEPRSVLLVSPGSIGTPTNPVAPDGDVLQALIDASVTFHVPSGHDTRPPRSVDEPIEVDSSGMTAFRRVFSGDGTSRCACGRGNGSVIVRWIKLDGCDLDAVVYRDTIGSSMFEQDIIELGADLTNYRSASLRVTISHAHVRHSTPLWSSPAH